MALEHILDKLGVKLVTKELAPGEEEPRLRCKVIEEEAPRTFEEKTQPENEEVPAFNQISDKALGIFFETTAKIMYYAAKGSLYIIGGGLLGGTLLTTIHINKQLKELYNNIPASFPTSQVMMIDQDVANLPTIINEEFDMVPELQPKNTHLARGQKLYYGKHFVKIGEPFNHPFYGQGYIVSFKDLNNDGNFGSIPPPEEYSPFNRPLRPGESIVPPEYKPVEKEGPETKGLPSLDYALADFGAN